MRVSTLLLTLMLGFFPLSALAGTDHGHSHGPVEITREQADKIASYRIAELVFTREIHKSWATVNPVKTEKRVTIDGNTEWVIAYSNDKEPDPAKSQLFVSLSSTGEFISSGFTGE